MTNIAIEKINNRIAEVKISGHTDYDVTGEDVLCAALSSITQTALLGLLSVCAINVKFDRDEKRGFLGFRLPENLSENQIHDAEIILRTMLAGIADLAEGYSDFIKLEVNQYVY